ncbi:MAG: glucokinase [Stutzerimonas stutzeri]
MPGEGGHVCLPIGSEREAAIWTQAAPRTGPRECRSRAQRAGIVDALSCRCALDGRAAEHDSPAEITKAALAGDPVRRGRPWSSSAAGLGASSATTC